jgi:hypothetical protein
MLKKSQNTAAIGFALSSLCLLLTGCGIGGSTATPTTPTGTPGVALHGLVFGGQQPLYGATINLYATGTTGYGSTYPANKPGSVSLLGSHVVTTDPSGGFNITGDYTCPTGSYVYIEAVGGSPDGVLADNNPNVIMLAALGLCSNLSSASFITMNELTTVASVWALAPFMTGPTNIGTSPGNSVGLANAFASVNTLVNIGYGQLNTTSLPAGATIPTAKLNTLGNILAACVNVPLGSAGAAGNACTQLFPAATPSGGTTPTDTLTAAMNIAQHPGNNASTLFPIAGKYAQFGPTVLTSAPTDWTLSIRYTAGGALTATTVPSGIAADQAGNIWITNNGTENRLGNYTTKPSLVEISPKGVLMQTQSEAAYLGVTIDQNGNAWSSFNYLNETSSGSPGTTTAFNYTTAAQQGGLTIGDIPALAVDSLGNIWATSGSALAEFSNAGVAKSPSGGYAGGGITNGSDIAITTH